MTAFVLASFTALFVTVNPIKVAAIYPALTGDAKRAEQRRMAVQGVLVASAILLLFALLGDDLLRVIGVSLSGVRVGGGILLMLLSIDIVFGHPIGTTAPGDHGGGDVSVFPLATPMIAGPGAITATVVQATEARNTLSTTVLLLAVLAAVMLITLALLLAASAVERALGHVGMTVVSRVLGILLAAVSAEMILAGLRESHVFG